MTESAITCTACGGLGWYYVGDWSQGYPKGRCKVCRGAKRIVPHPHQAGRWLPAPRRRGAP
jgi:hypothetical protein